MASLTFLRLQHNPVDSFKHLRVLLHEHSHCLPVCGAHHSYSEQYLLSNVIPNIWRLLVVFSPISEIRNDRYTQMKREILLEWTNCKMTAFGYKLEVKDQMYHCSTSTTPTNRKRKNTKNISFLGDQPSTVKDHLIFSFQEMGRAPRRPDSAFDRP